MNVCESLTTEWRSSDDVDRVQTCDENPNERRCTETTNTRMTR
jgi:hypothetical protein